MNKFFFLFYFYCIHIFSIEKYTIGDPFNYIKSNILLLKNKTEFLNAINNEDFIVAIISYNNSFYGNEVDNFTKMIRIYQDIYTLFSNNKKIKFYRVYMLKGIAGSLVAETDSAIVFFYKNQYIKTLNNTISKNNIISEISKMIGLYIK